MKAEWKAKWQAALLSGEYEQGNGALNVVADNTYCCLGVLCNLINPAGWERMGDGFFIAFDGSEVTTTVELEHAYWSLEEGTTQDDSYPPTEVQELLGMTHSDFELCGEWNDKDKLTFEQIARKIEETF